MSPIRPRRETPSPAGTDDSSQPPTPATPSVAAARSCPGRPTPPPSRRASVTSPGQLPRVTGPTAARSRRAGASRRAGVRPPSRCPDHRLGLGAPLTSRPPVLPAPVIARAPARQLAGRPAGAVPRRRGTPCRARFRDAAGQQRKHGAARGASPVASPRWPVRIARSSRRATGRARPPSAGTPTPSSASTGPHRGRGRQRRAAGQPLAGRGAVAPSRRRPRPRSRRSRAEAHGCIGARAGRRVAPASRRPPPPARLRRRRRPARRRCRCRVQRLALSPTGRPPPAPVGGTVPGRRRRGCPLPSPRRTWSGRRQAAVAAGLASPSLSSGCRRRTVTGYLASSRTDRAVPRPPAAAPWPHRRIAAATSPGTRAARGTPSASPGQRQPQPGARPQPAPLRPGRSVEPGVPGPARSGRSGRSRRDGRAASTAGPAVGARPAVPVSRPHGTRADRAGTRTGQAAPTGTRSPPPPGRRPGHGRRGAGAWPTATPTVRWSSTSRPAPTGPACRPVDEPTVAAGRTAGPTRAAPPPRRGATPTGPAPRRRRRPRARRRAAPASPHARRAGPPAVRPAGRAAQGRAVARPRAGRPAHRPAATVRSS